MEPAEALPLQGEKARPKKFRGSSLLRSCFPYVPVVIFLNLSFTGVFYAYTVSLAIPCLLLIRYAIKHLPASIRYNAKQTANPVATELLLFSIPLLGVAMLQMIIAWTDTLMLGYFRLLADVGLYNAALPLAQNIALIPPLGIVGAAIASVMQ